MYGLEHPERSQSERTRREDRHLKFYARWDNLEFRREAVELVLAGRSVRDVAQSLGCSDQSLHTSPDGK